MILQPALSDIFSLIDGDLVMNIVIDQGKIDCLKRIRSVLICREYRRFHQVVRFRDPVVFPCIGKTGYLIKLIVIACGLCGSICPGIITAKELLVAVGYVIIAIIPGASTPGIADDPCAVPFRKQVIQKLLLADPLCIGSSGSDGHGTGGLRFRVISDHISGRGIDIIAEVFPGIIIIPADHSHLVILIMSLRKHIFEARDAVSLQFFRGIIPSAVIIVFIILAIQSGPVDARGQGPIIHDTGLDMGLPARIFSALTIFIIANVSYRKRYGILHMDLRGGLSVSDGIRLKIFQIFQILIIIFPRKIFHPTHRMIFLGHRT